MCLELQLYLDFLNKNNGAIIAILTTILVLITGAYALLTRSLVNETQKMREAQTEPKITAIIESDERYINWINLIIQNIGLGLAYNVEFKVVPDFEEPERDFKVSKIGFIKNGLRYLAPDQKLKTFLTNTGDDFKQKCSKSFTIKISYQDAVGKKYNEDYLVDFSQRAGLREVGKPGIEKIADSVERIEKNFQSYMSQEANRRDIQQQAINDRMQAIMKIYRHDK